MTKNKATRINQNLNVCWYDDDYDLISISSFSRSARYSLKVYETKGSAMMSADTGKRRHFFYKNGWYNEMRVWCNINNCRILTNEIRVNTGPRSLNVFFSDCLQEYSVPNLDLNISSRLGDDVDRLHYYDRERSDWIGSVRKKKSMHAHVCQTLRYKSVQNDPKWFSEKLK